MTKATKIYQIKKCDQYDPYKVILIRTGRAVYFGTLAECRGWVERNGDEEQE